MPGRVIQAFLVGDGARDIARDAAGADGGTRKPGCDHRLASDPGRIGRGGRPLPGVLLAKIGHERAQVLRQRPGRVGTPAGGIAVVRDGATTPTTAIAPGRTRIAAGRASRIAHREQGLGRDLLAGAGQS